MKSAAVFSFMVMGLLLLSSGCSTPVAAPTPTPYSTTVTPSPAPPRTVTLTPKPVSPSPTITPTVPPGYVTIQQYNELEGRLKKAEGEIAGFKAIEGNVTTLMNSKTDLENRVQQLEINLQRLQNQVQGPYTLNFINKNGVEIHTLVTTDTIYGLLSNIDATADFFLRIYNNSGSNVTSLVITGNIRSSFPMTGLNSGYPTLGDSANYGMHYDSAWDGSQLYTFEILSNSNGSPISLAKDASLDLKPRLTLRGNATSQIYNFTLTVTDVTFVNAK